MPISHVQKFTQQATSMLLNLKKMWFSIKWKEVFFKIRQTFIISNKNVVFIEFEIIELIFNPGQNDRVCQRKVNNLIC